MANSITLLNAENTGNVGRDLASALTETSNMFKSQPPKPLTFDITNLDEPAKAKLRGMMKFFSGDKNNTPIQVVDGGEIKPCGTIYMTDEIQKQFEEFL